MTIEKVVVHPLVLRNIFHKHHCVVKNTGRRGVGVLLGWRHRGIVSVTNSCAVLFKEDSIWSFDQTHHKSMLRMFESFSERDVVVGWYSTSPEPHVNNLDIHAVFRKHPDTNAISNRCTTVTLRGEFAEEKALALNGTDVEGWTVTVKVLPPAMTELMSGKSPRELALEYLAHNC
ncbi:hypothetical protein Bca101_095692 [Brassica carinata]|uniref:JAB1/MPN/MOV34 metalloenzyme domain-containing protein n=1 Tax=Brassica oleracea var. oleracea TaxID=109376 RepID=A0A0D3DYR2_BRAOL